MDGEASPPAESCSEKAVEMGFCCSRSMAFVSPASAAIHVKMHRVSGYQGYDWTRHLAACIGLATYIEHNVLQALQTRLCWQPLTGNCVRKSHLWKAALKGLTLTKKV